MMSDMQPAGALSSDVLLAHIDWMRALARRLVDDPAGAEDLVQESLVAAVERPPTHAGNLRGWLRVVITNRARQKGRSDSRRRTREPLGAKDEALPSTLELVAQAGLTREIVAVVLALNEPYRTTVLLRFYRDQTPSQIAALQGVPAATVRTRLRRALEQLRSVLDDSHGGDRRAWCSALVPLLRPATPSSAVGVASSTLVVGVLIKAAPWSGELCYSPGRCAVPVDENGRYLISNVEPGPVLVRVAFGQSKCIPDPPMVVAVAGETVEHDISWSEELLSIRGTVRHADGTPATGEMVRAGGRASGGVGRSFQAEVASDGTYELRVVPDLVYRVRCMREDAVGVFTTKPDVQAGSENVDLVLPAVGKVRLDPVDARTGRRVILTHSGWYSLAWRRSGAEQFTRVAQPMDGDPIELTLPVGSVDSSVFPSGDGYAPRQLLSVPVLGSTGEPPLVEIALDPGVACKLQLKGDVPARLYQEPRLILLLHEEQDARGPFEQRQSSHDRIQGLNVWLGEPGLRQQAVHFDRTRGAAFVEGLRPGRYRLQAFPADLRFEPEEFLLDPEAESRVTVELRCSER